MRLVAPAVAIALMNSLASAQTPAASPADLAPVLEPIRTTAGLPALAAVVLSGDQVVAQGATGVRQAGASAAVTMADKFHLGSDTKAMTATLLALLVEEGRLTWNTTVGDVLGPVVPQMNPAWRPVTLAQLLTHHAGAPADLDAGGLWGRLWQREGSPTAQRLQLARGVLARPPVNPPGTAYVYSNAGFALAGAMAEQVTGRPWEDLMQERLFAPLGITSAGFGAPGTPGRVDQPLGHTTGGQPVPPGPRADNPPAIAPAGTVHMTLPDWAKFVALHLRGDPSNPRRECRLLQPATFARLHHAVPDETSPYAMGWGVLTRSWARGATPQAQGRTLTHAGSNTMWYCVTWLAPERDFAVLVACNRGGDGAAKACDQAASELIKRFLPPR
ncbi:MAG TPA: serine hydrolase domain-containing protein [Lacunisphaera sp.]|nr:serine hydrolase domain-containing protein [Lacunisphaera sp.]